jgi:hypothetical protein
MAEPQLTDSTSADPREIAAFLALPHPEFFEYEYKQYEPEHAVFIQARADGKLVGSQALIPCPLVIDGRVTLVGRSERTKVDASQRGGKLFPRLMEMCAEQGAAKGLELIWGTTVLKKALERVGFWYYDQYNDHAMLCANPVAAVRNLATPQPRNLRLAKLATLLPSLAARRLSAVSAASLDVQTTLRNRNDVFDLYERLRGDGSLIVMHHDEQMLEWLLGEPRTVLRYYGYAEGRLMAYAYIDITDPNDCRMSDFGAENGKALRSLLRHVTREVSKRGVPFVRVMYNGRNPQLRRLRPALTQAGFIPFFRGGGFVIRPLTFADPAHLNDISKWYITGMWVQLYPGT